MDPVVCRWRCRPARRYGVEPLAGPPDQCSASRPPPPARSSAFHPRSAKKSAPWDRHTILLLGWVAAAGRSGRSWRPARPSRDQRGVAVPVGSGSGTASGRPRGRPRVTGVSTAAGSACLAVARGVTVAGLAVPGPGPSTAAASCPGASADSGNADGCCSETSKAPECRPRWRSGIGTR